MLKNFEVRIEVIGGYFEVRVEVVGKSCNGAAYRAPGGANRNDWL